MNGIFLIDKEPGCTSRDVVNEIMRKTETAKVGHTGTLDPMASGVLIICVGRATKLVSHLTASDKEYLAEITLGIATDTLDSTGEIIKEEFVDISDEDIIAAVTSMLGEYEQEVPIYSAIKIKGKKLYEYARAKENVVLPKRRVNIMNINMASPIKRENGRIIFSIECKVSKGTYIRSLVRDIALKLNTIGIMSNLRRKTQGKFTIDECKKIDDISLLDIKPIKYCLRDVYTVYATDVLKKEILNGKIIKNIYDSDEVLFIDENENVLALYHVYEKDTIMLKPNVMIGGIK